MHTTSEKTTKQKMILAKAILAAAERLGLTQDQLALTLNIDSVTLGALTLDPTSKQGELALTLIRIATSLDALTGGDTAWMQHFMKSSNKLISGIPMEQVQTSQGLASVLQFVEGLRTKL
ncbi:antitoxin Xre/MbcA/ParS toxin-binding domain-containing protein [Acinetobacter faecalis]|uniref:antitoxin Xre/MbcA/ParS toxin-binding domain-containing protein n=1 Tax=Acinetobacter faecalis TaxID=2665161 RepID=UPI002A920566|nr:antitoxin Xre/MbcA/ParS toxin-binding domain-containing protein [Acinetobacter faecalis]MDY6531272.1 antitoxin Xre-like helix-turn-helix domain-containing protein [Acinetobacter faecalis]